MSACSAIPLPVRSPLSPPPHNSTQSFTHANHSHIHSINITSALIRHPTTAAPAAVAAAPTSRRTAGLGVGSATAATARLRRNRQRRRRNRQLRQNRWRLRRKSAAVTLRRRLRYRRLQPLQRCAAVRIWRREMSLLCACRCSATAFSSPPLGHQVAWSKHLCKLQRKLVRNSKSKKWSMLGSSKHFAIGKKDARRVWYLSVGCARCTQGAIALR